MRDGLPSCAALLPVAAPELRRVRGVHAAALQALKLGLELRKLGMGLAGCDLRRGQRSLHLRNCSLDGLQLRGQLLPEAGLRLAEGAGHAVAEDQGLLHRLRPGCVARPAAGQRGAVQEERLNAVGRAAPGGGQRSADLGEGHVASYIDAAGLLCGRLRQHKEPPARRDARGAEAAPVDRQADLQPGLHRGALRQGSPLVGRDEGASRSAGRPIGRCSWSSGRWPRRSRLRRWRSPGVGLLLPRLGCQRKLLPPGWLRGWVLRSGRLQGRLPRRRRRPWLRRRRCQSQVRRRRGRQCRLHRRCGQRSLHRRRCQCQVRRMRGHRPVRRRSRQRRLPLRGLK
mmetsp:Transcript_48542/g.150252  ORF Transcript_48542/g.150252 Transcript_48542/m.150252 type:complete len:341 (+) Transcript_48542:372-1394(+)